MTFESKTWSFFFFFFEIAVDIHTSFSLWQALQNLLRRTEEARGEAAAAQRELVTLGETCEGLEQARGKLQSELTNKEIQNSFLTCQLNSTKSALEKELAKVGWLMGVIIFFFLW